MRARIKQVAFSWLALPSALLTLAGGARADVTVEQKMTMDLSFMKAHSSSTELITSDKQRRNSDFHCEGFMSMLCGNAQSGEITRLDKDVKWELEPKKKAYKETRFPTAAEREAVKQRMQAALEKMKQCPVPQQPNNPAPDTSKCEMSPPKFDVKQTDQHASFLGHDARLAQLSMTQSCKNRDTGDTCDYVMSFDSWLTQDELPGRDEQLAFQKAYLHKMGLDDLDLTAQMQQQMRQFLAPYQSNLKELATKAKDLKGQPLKTAFRVSFGGAQCAAAKQRAAQQPAGGGNVVADAGEAAAQSGASTAAGVAGAQAGNAAGRAGGAIGGSILGSAASTFGNKIVGGLFAKKKAPDAGNAAAQANTATAGAAAPANLFTLVEIDVETTAIRSGSIAPAEFDIPAGWKLIPPKAEKAEKEFTCPSAAPDAKTGT